MRSPREGDASQSVDGAKSGAQLVVGIAAALCSTTAITASLGFVFWAVAARLAAPAVVGNAAAVISALEFIAVFATLGLHTLLMAEIPRRDRASADSLVVMCFAVAASVAVCVALAFAVLRHLMDHHESMYASPISVGLFGVGAAVSTVVIVVDGALTGLSRNRQQVTRNLVFAITKLLALPIGALAVGMSPQVVVFVWVLGNLVSVLTLIARRPTETFGRRLWKRPSVSELAPIWRIAAAHHWVNVATQAPRLMLPIMVATQLGDEANAGFYAALLMATFIWIIPNNLGVAMFALHSGSPEHFRTGLDAAIRLSAAVSVAAAVGGPLLAHPLLSLFGPAYVHAQDCLTALSICTFGGAVKAIYIAVRRATGALAVAAKVAVAGAIWELCAAEAGLLIGGVTGLGIAMGAAVVVEAAFLWPTISRARRATPADQSGTGSAWDEKAGEKTLSGSHDNGTAIK